jgi:hypothetical protein
MSFLKELFPQNLEEMRNLIWGGLVGFLLVYVVDYFRRPKIKIELLKLPVFNKWEGKLDLFGMKISNCQNTLKSLSISNLRLFCSVYAYKDFLVKRLRVQCIPGDVIDLSDSGISELYLFSGTNLVLGESVFFSFLYRYTDDRKQYAIYDYLNFMSHNQTEVSQRFLRESSDFLLIQNEEYYLEVEAVSDQCRVKKFYVFSFLNGELEFRDARCPV